ncbi:orotate phosphoribosyltransferase [Afipia sp. GAS231]|uniref:orotate phosphoribosyltransferase n=1 Tax=Afipia sp. GAS231 TaxID=1882747 RepID=UPI00087D24C0|nr:orotate phosphoribosyltransferase [Afipia sp. GAS231]SDN55156.1 orotate phosphoribosyltransferase [Afipia sp. GAS231]
MTVEDLGAATARLLIEAGAIQISQDRPYVLAAGWASPVYVDCRLLIGEPRLRREAVRLAALAGRRLRETVGFDAVAGAETAGIPFASWLADALDVPLRYVRKRPLGIGHNAQVEGGPVDGLRVLLVDDLTTDATSKVSFATGLRQAGADVTDVLTIFYHSAFPGASERLAQTGLTLHPLATWDDIMRIDLSGRLNAGDRAHILDFLDDPVAWSTRHGGRSALPPRKR